VTPANAKRFERALTLACEGVIKDGWTIGGPDDELDTCCPIGALIRLYAPHPCPDTALRQLQLIAVMFGSRHGPDAPKAGTYVTTKDLREFMRSFDGAPPFSIAGRLGAQFRIKYAQKKGSKRNETP